jgi:hypothetical protein
MQGRAKSAAERTPVPAAYRTAKHKYRDSLAGEKEHRLKRLKSARWLSVLFKGTLTTNHSAEIAKDQ